MSYLSFFGMDREPFSNAPDSRFYYNSDQHEQALVRILHCIDSNKGLALVVGGAGTGKTTLARRTLDTLAPENYQSSLLVMVHSGITPEWILTRIAMQLGVPTPSIDRLVLLKQLYERLLEIEAGGRKAVVLIDEAQMLQTRELMEEFRGLLNLEVPGKKLLNLVFFGLPEVEDSLKLDEPLAQRVALKYQLRSLDEKSIDAYVKHRLKVAGAQRMLFAAGTLEAIHAYSRGIPRLINTLCDNCLFEAFMRKVAEVDLHIVYSVAGDFGLLPAEGVEAAPKLNDDLDEIDMMLDGLKAND